MSANAVDAFDFAKSFDVGPEVMETYERDGVVILVQPFVSELVSALADRIRSVIHELNVGRSELVTRQSPGRLEIYNAIRRDELCRRFVAMSRAAEICARVCGSSTSRFYFDVTFCKFGADELAASAAATSFHHDVAAFAFKGSQLPSLWLALTDVPMKAGPLMVALGSHRSSSPLFRSAGEYASPPAPGYVDHSTIKSFVRDRGFEIRSFPVAAGDALVIHPYVLHASAATSAGDVARMAFCTRWIGDDVRWHPSPYTQQEARSYPRTLETGAPPPPDWFPIAWGAAAGPSGGLAGAGP